MPKKIQLDVIVPGKKSKRPRSTPSPHKFAPGNPWRFQPGVSGNPGGRPRTEKKLSAAFRAELGQAAVGEICTALGLPAESSWATVVARATILNAARGDVAAAREAREATEGSKSRVEVLDENGDVRRPPSLNIVIVPGGAPQLHGPQPVAKKLPARERQSSEMIPPDAAERAAGAIVAAVKKGSPRSIETVNRHLPEGWVLDPAADVAGLEQATSAAHWTDLLRTGAVPQQ